MTNLTRYVMLVSFCAMIGASVRFASPMLGAWVNLAFLTVLAVTMAWVFRHTRWSEERYTPRLMLAQNASIGGVFGWSLTSFLVQYDGWLTRFE